MSDQVVTLVTDSSNNGKNVDTSQLTNGSAQTVQRQRVAIGDNSTFGQFWGIDANGFGKVGLVPLGTPVNASSTGGAQANNCTLSGVASKTTYITGFAVTGTGATSQSTITVTVTGVTGAPLNYTINIPAGATTSITPLVVTFPLPIPATTTNTAVVVNVPTFGAGNLAASAVAYGFQL